MRKPWLESLETLSLLSISPLDTYLPIANTSGSPWKLVTQGDFESAGHSDLVLYRPTTGQWLIRTASGATEEFMFGDPAQGDEALPGDYEGNGKIDLAVFRPSTGQFIIRDVSGAVQVESFPGFQLGDLPVPADYEGIGRTDLAIFRPSTDEWFIQVASGQVVRYQMGNPSDGDIPVPADYEGIGRIDLAVFRPGTDQWIVRESNGSTRIVQMGDPSFGDIPVPGDYEGIGKADLAVYRPSTGLWIIRESNGTTFSAQFGSPTDGDVPAGPAQTYLVAPTILNGYFRQNSTAANWYALHNEFVANAASQAPNVVFLGDSITYLWSDSTATPSTAAFRSSFIAVRGGKPWNSTFAPLGAVNYGIPGDTTGDLLWRVQNGEIQGSPKAVVLMVGLNDLDSGKTPRATATGIIAVVNAIRAESPSTKVLLLGIMPRGLASGPDPLLPAITLTNNLVSLWAASHGVTFRDFGSLLAGNIDNYGHPGPPGYEIIARAIKGPLVSLLNSN